jgi:hypothetical protein
MSRDRQGAPASVPSHDAIARRAYELCEQRGGAPGHELDDWLAAERELFATDTAVETPVADAVKPRRRAPRTREASAS